MLAFYAAGAMAAVEVRALYHQIMRTARSYPSVKRDKVIGSIRDEFRENMHEADPAKLKKMVAEARDGLTALRQQCGMSARGKDINYQYDAALQPPR